MQQRFRSKRRTPMADVLGQESLKMHILEQVDPPETKVTEYAEIDAFVVKLPQN